MTQTPASGRSRWSRRHDVVVVDRDGRLLRTCRNEKERPDEREQLAR